MNATRETRPRETGTQRAYASDWAAFASWCALEGAQPLPATAAVLLAYARSLIGSAKASTLRRKLSAIRSAHRERGHVLHAREPELVALLSELDQRRGARPEARAVPTGQEMARMVRALPRTLAGLRDRALILAAWSLVCRPADLVALDVDDVTASSRRVTLRLGSRPGAEPRELELWPHADPEICAVRWLRAWSRLVRDERGPFFRPVNRHGRLGVDRLTVQTVRLVLRRAAVAVDVPVDRISADGICAAPRADLPLRAATG